MASTNRKLQVFTQGGLVCIRMYGCSIDEVEDGTLCPVLRFDYSNLNELIEALQTVKNSIDK